MCRRAVAQRRAWRFRPACRAWGGSPHGTRWEGSQAVAGCNTAGTSAEVPGGAPEQEQAQGAEDAAAAGEEEEEEEASSDGDEGAQALLELQSTVEAEQVWARLDLCTRIKA